MKHIPQYLVLGTALKNIATRITVQHSISSYALLAFIAIHTPDAHAQKVNQSQDFKITVKADSHNQWEGKRNKIWNSWKSTNGHGFQFIKDTRKVTDKFQITEMKNVRIMGGYKQPDKHHWLKEIKNGEPICDFTGLIKILQKEMELGIRPAIILDQVPWALADWKDGYSYGDVPSAKTVNYYSPRYGYSGHAVDFEIWQKYVKMFIQTCIDNFGKEEVTKWMFRVSTEPNNGKHWLASWEDYLKHYDYTVEAVLEIIPNAYIGPGNFIGAWFAVEQLGYSTDKWNGRKKGSVEDFLKHCAEGTNYATGKKGTRMTFLAFSAYTNLSAKTPSANSLPFEPCFERARQLLDGKYKVLHKYIKDNDAIPQWFPIDVHEYGDLPSLSKSEWLWATEWMAGMHAYTMELAYTYGVNKTSFWFQSRPWYAYYPYVRVNEMLSKMEGGSLVEIKKQTVSENEKLKYGAIAAWKNDALYVLVYNFNWDPLKVGNLQKKRTHTIDNTITLTIEGERISTYKKWDLEHSIINEKTGNASWYYEARKDLDNHEDLSIKDPKKYVIRLPTKGWKGPIKEILTSTGEYSENGLFDKYNKLSEMGVVTDSPATVKIDRQGNIVFSSVPFTQSGVQLLKFTPSK